MSQYIVLSKMSIQNANSIAGFTWGFPAITHFLGFTHALSRKISSSYQGRYDSELSGCAVICHTYENKVYRPSRNSDLEFLQSKNPPVFAKNKAFRPSPPIIEEGKMNLSVSMVLELERPLNLTVEEVNFFEKEIADVCHKLRMAGGSVLSIRKVKLLSGESDKQIKKMLLGIKKLTLPGFVLRDRSEYLHEYFTEMKENKPDESTNLLQAWLDFSALKSKAFPLLEEGEGEPGSMTKAKWEFCSKPHTGWLVPLMIGYKAISDGYSPDVVKNARDDVTPTRFVEPIHSVGEWSSANKIEDLDLYIWRHTYENPWYLCQQSSSERNKENTALDSDDSSVEINFNEAFENL